VLAEVLVSVALVQVLAGQVLVLALALEMEF
jgi:hypothetical protein